MVRKSIINVFGIITLGLMLYVGVCELMGYPLVSSPRTEKITPVKTGLEGSKMPDIVLMLPDSTVSIRAAINNVKKPTVLFYFSPYCPYCQAELGDILDNIDFLSGIQFYLITPFSYGEMKSFYDTSHLAKYRNVVVGVDYRNSLGDYFRIQAVPYLAVYNKDLEMNAAFMGKVGHKQLFDVANR